MWFAATEILRCADPQLFLWEIQGCEESDLRLFIFHDDCVDESTGWGVRLLDDESNYHGLRKFSSVRVARSYFHQVRSIRLQEWIELARH